MFALSGPLAQRGQSAFAAYCPYEGPRTQLIGFQASGLKYYNSNGIWALWPCYLGPWTLRVCLSRLVLGLSGEGRLRDSVHDLCCGEP